MCEINPKHTKILRLEFFTSLDMSEEDFLLIIARIALEQEMMANKDARIRCHIHEVV
jgi:hypothetical protein